MNWRRCQLVVGFLILTVAFAGHLGAEDPNGYGAWDLDSDSQYPESGLKWGIADPIPIAIPSIAFSGFNASQNSRIRGTGSYRYCDGGLCVLSAPVYPPNGSSIISLKFRGYDADPSAHVLCSMIEFSDDTETFTTIESLGTDDPFVGGFFASNVPVNPPYTIDTTQNTYAVRCFMEGGTDDTRLQNFRLEYRLQVSPAPGTATFSDVPVGAFGFQHVEALAASGITAGCGGGNFCPNDTLTRVQMAVFLAKALGLHWPG